MKPMLNPQDQKTIHDISTTLTQTYEQANRELEKFYINANKSAAKRARQSLMDMVRKAKELRNAIQHAKIGIITIDPIDPVEYITKIIVDNNDLDSLQNAVKRLEIKVNKRLMFIPECLAEEIAEYFINNGGRDVEPNDEFGNVIKMAQKLNLKLGDLVGTK